MNRQQFEALLDELVKTAGQQELHAATHKKVMLAYTKLLREIDRLEEDVILQAYKK